MDVWVVERSFYDATRDEPDVRNANSPTHFAPPDFCLEDYDVDSTTSSFDWPEIQARRGARWKVQVDLLRWAAAETFDSSCDAPC